LKCPVATDRAGHPPWPMQSILYKTSRLEQAVQGCGRTGADKRFTTCGCVGAST